MVVIGPCVPIGLNVTRHALKVHLEHQTGEERSTALVMKDNCEYC